MAPKSNKKQQLREKREELRAKATGALVGKRIDNSRSATRNSNKIVFDDEEADETQTTSALELEDNSRSKEKTTEESNHESVEDDDDDAAEEVDTSALKAQLLLEEQNREKATSLAMSSKKKTRKRKTLTPDKEDDDDDEDEVSVDLEDNSFFQQLHQERKEQKDAQKNEKRTLEKNLYLGKRTTFVVSNDENEADTSAIVLAGQNDGSSLQVVVLDEDSSARPVALFQPTEQALQLSKTTLIADGSDGVKPSTWKRSRQMYRLLNAKQSRKQKVGLPAPMFRVKK